MYFPTHFTSRCKYTSSESEHPLPKPPSIRANVLIRQSLGEIAFQLVLIFLGYTLRSAVVICLEVLNTAGQLSQPLSSLFTSHFPQMTWQGQHWSQRPLMPGPPTLCTLRSWPPACLTPPSLTRRPLPLLQPSTPRWGSNRCVPLISLPFPSTFSLTHSRAHTP